MTAKQDFAFTNLGMAIAVFQLHAFSGCIIEMFKHQLETVGKQRR